MKNLVLSLILLCCCMAVEARPSSGAAILVYHNFNPSIPGSMTLTSERVETQLQWLKTNGYTVIPLKTLVDYLMGKNDTLPQKVVALTADDGHKSVYQYLLPLAQKYHVPVTLFIYPSAIGRPGFLTWDQLKALQQTGLFDIEGHTGWHPNFKHEKKHLSPEAYQKLVHSQLFDSKATLEKQLGTPITLLAWPYGIYDAYLEQEAAKAGYTMAFSIDYRRAKRSEKPMAEPRYMMVAEQSMQIFAGIVLG